MPAKNLPQLTFEEWDHTRTTLQLYLQIVGKIRMATSPPLNHWWHVTLYPTVRGLTTGRLRQNGHEFEIAFDFIDHRLLVSTTEDREERFRLKDGLSVARFYRKVFDALYDLGIMPEIRPVPYGMPVVTRFDEDTEHDGYDEDAVEDWWRVLRWTADVMRVYQSDFVGKQSPPQLFWHSMDLAIGRFNGKRAPQRDGANSVEREAYSHEVIASGFWGGDANTPFAAYYTYTAPEPSGLTQHPLVPQAAHWVKGPTGNLGVLPYDNVRNSEDSEGSLLQFFRSGYDGGSLAGGWDRQALARGFSQP